MDEPVQEKIEIEESPEYYYPKQFYNPDEKLSKIPQYQMGRFTWEGED